MVARTGHVWHVGSERLNLIHVSIADASIVLVNSKLTMFRPTSSQALSQCIIDSSNQYCILHNSIWPTFKLLLLIKNLNNH